jgi:bis(5'-nucleosyl)-tetraphosphatase (symmetrical)
MSTWAIGDVQGCYRTLVALEERIGFEPGRDRLWFVGDLVNRGPRSLSVLRHVRKLGRSATVVLGNHDLHLLGLAAGVRRERPGDTLGKVLKAEDRERLLRWLRKRPLLHREGDLLLVHAGLFPGWKTREAEAAARSAEERLCGDGWRKLVAREGPAQDRMEDCSKALERDRTALHALTRMRTLHPDGSLARSFKGPPSEADEGLVPWFRHPDRRTARRTVVFGHWSTLGVTVEPNVVSLDSGVAWGGQLTACRLEDRRVVQQANLDVPRPRRA